MADQYGRKAGKEQRSKISIFWWRTETSDCGSAKHHTESDHTRDTLRYKDVEFKVVRRFAKYWGLGDKRANQGVAHDPTLPQSDEEARC